MEGSFDNDVLIGDAGPNSMLGQPGEDELLRQRRRRRDRRPRRRPRQVDPVRPRPAGDRRAKGKGRPGHRQARRPRPDRLLRPAPVQLRRSSSTAPRSPASTADRAAPGHRSEPRPGGDSAPFVPCTPCGRQADDGAAHGPLCGAGNAAARGRLDSAAAALGYTRSSASKAKRAGRLRRLHRGVYAVGHERLTWHGRCMAAVLACSPAVASHTSAGWLWGLLRTCSGHDPCNGVRPRGAPSRVFVVHFAELAERTGSTDGRSQSPPCPHRTSTWRRCSPTARLERTLWSGAKNSGCSI